MNRALLSKRTSSLLAEVSRLSNALCAMNTMDLQRYLENYELLSTDAALRAEQIACRMRLHRFCCALTLHNQTGGILCFDYQAEALQEVFGAQVNITSIDFAAYERMMLHQ